MTHGNNNKNKGNKTMKTAMTVEQLETLKDNLLECILNTDMENQENKLIVTNKTKYNMNLGKMSAYKFVIELLKHYNK